jgi:hypothetical protein
MCAVRAVAWGGGGGPAQRVGAPRGSRTDGAPPVRGRVTCRNDAPVVEGRVWCADSSRRLSSVADGQRYSRWAALGLAKCCSRACVTLGLRRMS